MPLYPEYLQASACFLFRFIFRSGSVRFEEARCRKPRIGAKDRARGSGCLLLWGPAHQISPPQGGTKPRLFSLQEAQFGDPHVEYTTWDAPKIPTSYRQKLVLLHLSPANAFITGSNPDSVERGIRVIREVFLFLLKKIILQDW